MFSWALSHDVRVSSGMMWLKRRSRPAWVLASLRKLLRRALRAYTSLRERWVVRRLV
jgi:hypothetical protein